MSIPESELSYGSILTLTGENAEINGKLNNKPINFTHIAIGDANDVYVQPSRTQTTLVNEITRIPVTGMEKITPSEPDGVPQLKVWAKIPDNIVDIAVREFAAVATFDGNSYLHAVGNSVRIPILSGSNNGGEVNDIYIEMTFAVTSLEPIVMIDPAIVTATRTFVEEQDAKHVAASHPHSQYLKTSEYSQDKIENENSLAKLPHYPEMMTVNNQLDISLVGTTLTIADNQILRLYGWKDFNTNEFQTKSFEIDLAKTYHLRFTESNGLELKDLSDVVYNPTSKAETDPIFDSTYDDMLLAKIEAGTLIPLINKPELNAEMQMVGMSTNPVHPARIFTYNWARTPIQSEGLVIGINAHGIAAFEDWNFSGRENVTAFDVLLVNLNRYMVHHKYRANDSNPSWEGGQLGVRFKQEVKA